MLDGRQDAGAVPAASTIITWRNECLSLLEFGLRTGWLRRKKTYQNI